MDFIDSKKYKNSIGIYCIENTINGKKYIGQTREGFLRRYWHHNWCLANCSHFNKSLQEDWNIYGSDNFRYYVVYILQDGDNIDALEEKYILKNNTSNQLYGYNLQSGNKPEDMHKFVSAEGRKITGEKNRQHMLGRKLPEQTKAKMRASSKHLSPTVETRRKISEYMSNRIVSEETRNKLREKNTGSNSPVTSLTEDDVARIKIRLMNFEIQREIASDYNVSIGTIGAIANGRTWKHVVVDGWQDYLANKKK